MKKEHEDAKHHFTLVNKITFSSSPIVNRIRNYMHTSQLRSMIFYGKELNLFFFIPNWSKGYKTSHMSSTNVSIRFTIIVDTSTACNMVAMTEGTLLGTKLIKELLEKLKKRNALIRKQCSSPSRRSI